jgi:dihydroorotase
VVVVGCGSNNSNKNSLSRSFEEDIDGMSLELIVNNARLVTENGIFYGNLGIKEGKIAGLFSIDHMPPAAQVIDADGKIVMPGAIDAHVHIPVGNGTYRGDFSSEGKAALLGGTTTVIDFVISQDLSLLDSFWAKKEEVAKLSPVDFAFHAVILNRKDLQDIPALVQEGIVSFKQFMCNVDDLPGMHTGLLYETYKILARLGATATVHAENNEIQEYLITELKKEGRKDPLAHAESRSCLAEVEAVSRAILLAEKAGIHLHVFHVSTGKAAQLIQQAKERGLKITGETCPHYLAFTQEDIKEKGPFLQVTPSIKFSADQKILWDNLADGSLDIVVSDHYAPTREEKEKGWDNIWLVEGGIPGIETRVPYLLHTGVLQKKFTLNRLADMVATRPAKIFGLYPQKGAIRVGADADVVIWDLEKEYVVDPASWGHRADWTPFEGMKWKGVPVLTILRGKVVVRDGCYLGQSGYGRFIRRNY